MPRYHPAKKSLPARQVHKRNLAWLWGGLGTLALIIAGIWVFGLKPAPVVPEAATTAPAVELTAAQAYARWQEGVFFLDVRTQEEWDEFHLKSSILIPLAELQDRLDELPKDQKIIVVCRSGHRSLSAVDLLQHAGFSQLASLSGGLQAWVDAGYPVEK